LFVVSIICLAILGIQIIYLLTFLIALGRKQDRPDQPPQPVSVIVCAHDEEENIRELVPLLLAQDHPEFEVIIVEDRCNDETYDYLLQATKEHSRLRMVRVANKPEHISGKKFALTLGIKAARYERVLLTDADCRPAGQEWIKSMTSSYDSSTEIVLGFSPYQHVPGLLNSFIRFESLLAGIQYISMAILGRPYMGVGRNLSYTKSLFLRNKGFNSHLEVTGGDDDLFINQNSTKQNTRICVGRETVMISKPKLTWSAFFHQKLRHLSVGRHYRFSDKVVLGLFAITGLLVWFLAFPMLFLTQWPYVLTAIFVVRTGLQIALFASASKKLAARFEAWKTPFLDFIFAFYYLVTGLRALVVKRIRWKN